MAVTDLDVRRGTNHVVRGVSFGVERGEIVALMGASGAGKTTVLRAVGGLDPVAGGSVVVDGLVMCAGERLRGAERRELHRRVGFVFQFHHLFDNLTALGNVVLAPVHVLGQARAAAELRARGLVAEQFDDAAQQHATAQFGMWVFLATEVLFFGVLFAGYAVCRVRDPEGFLVGSRHTEILFGAVEAGILLLSSATVTFAVNLIRFDERRVVAALLATTAILGIAISAPIVLGPSPAFANGGAGGAGGAGNGGAGGSGGTGGSPNGGTGSTPPSAGAGACCSRAIFCRRCASASCRPPARASPPRPVSSGFRPPPTPLRGPTASA